MPRRAPILAALVLTAAVAATVAHANDPTPKDMKGLFAKALAAESDAKRLLGTKNYAGASDRADDAAGFLNLILLAASAGREQGDIDPGDAQQIQKLAKSASHEDFVAARALKKRDKAAALAALAQAAQAKQLLRTAIDDAASSFGRCRVEKEFDVYAVPAGFAGSYADVFPHGVPQDATNIKFSFVDTATGKAPAAQLFPGQTWTATNKGFLADGRLDIHVDVTGTGFGAQDANKKHWKVVVTYDC
ncbi:MAG: hypothetical protein ABUS54_12510 [Actinomycetota bacterium]